MTSSVPIALDSHYGDEPGPDPESSFLSIGDLAITGVPKTGMIASRWWVAELPERPEDPTEEIRKTDRPSYVLRQMVARGGMGEVWEALQVSLDRVVAVKRMRVLEDDPRRSSLMREQFRQEALIAARLEHPNIVPVHDLGIDDKGEALLAMKMVRGVPWHTPLASDFVNLSVADFLARHLPILISTAQAVAFAHSRGILHRDIKPSQVMVGEYGEVLLGDWGLAMLMEESDERSPTPLYSLPTRTTASNPSGTPCLMAPEQTERDPRNLGPWTDIYLLGGTLYYLLTGYYPHSAPTSRDSMHLARKGLVIDPRRRARDREVPDQLAEVCLRALERDPGDRYDNARQFVDAIQNYLSGSSQRRESEALAKEARKKIAGGMQTYEAHDACLDEIKRARELWQRNPDLDELQADCVRSWTRLALDHGDLVLARMQCGLMEAGEERENTLIEIDIAEEKQRDREKQRVMALRAAVLLLTLVVCGGAIFTKFLSDARGNAENREQEARAQRLVANERRKSSEELVRYLLGEFQKQLLMDVERDRILAEGIRNQVIRAIGEVDLSLETDQGKLEHSELLDFVSGTFDQMGFYDDALRYASESLSIRRSVFPASHPAIAESLIRMADVLNSLAKYEEASALIAEAREIMDRFPDETLGLRPWALKLEGIQAIQRLDAELSLQKVDEALEIMRSHPAEFKKGDDASLLGMRVTALMRLSRMTEAESVAIDLDKLQEELQLPLIERAASKDQMGVLYHEMGRMEEALEAHSISLDWQRHLYPPDHPTIANYANNLATLFQELGQMEEAEKLFKESVEIRKAKLGPRHEDYAQSIHNLARLYDETCRYDEARALFDEALSICKESIGEENPVVAGIMTSIGMMELSRDNFAEAAEILEDALEMRRKTLPPGNPYICYSLEALAAAFSGNDQPERVLPLMEESSQISRDFVEQEPNDVRRRLLCEKTYLETAEYYLEDGQVGPAGEYLQRCESELGEPRTGEAMDPKDLYLRAYYSFVMARYQKLLDPDREMTGDWEKCLELLRTAIEAEPSARLRDLEIYALLQLGRIDDASTLVHNSSYCESISKHVKEAAASAGINAN